MPELVVEPRRVRTVEDFIADHSTRYGIALDGYVKGESWWDVNGPRANFNHHETTSNIESHGVRALYRVSTLSTAAQVHDAIKEHFLEYFRKNGKISSKIYVNDPDPDTALSIWELRNAAQFECKMTPDNLKDLLYVQDRLDRTSGAYPFDLNSPRLKSNYWIFEPYFTAKVSGLIAKMDAKGMESIISKCGERIDAYLVGKGRKLDPDTRHEILYEGPGWAMVREIGAQARPYLFKEKKKKLVITAIKNGHGRTIYSVTKKTPFVDFHAKEFVEDVNKAEGLLVGEGNSWGGSEDVFGSPRRTGSSLPMEEVVALLKRHLGPKFGQTLNMPYEEPESDEIHRRSPSRFGKR